MERPLTGGFLLIALAALPLHGQATLSADQTHIAFDVTSVKPNTSGSGTSSIGFEPGGRFRAVNEPVFRLIQEAFATVATPRPQIVGAPRWTESDNFDVEAVATGDFSQEQRQMMLQALLADRFKLRSHVETRTVPVYNLVKPSRDAKLGDKLRVSDGTCDALRKPGAPTPTAEQLRPCRLAFFRGSLSVNGMSANQFATAGLTRVVDRPVIDRTGLGETLYDWTIEWTDQSQGAAGGDSGLPSSVFSAVREQLGLKLEPAKGPIDVVVVDHVERPAED